MITMSYQDALDPSCMTSPKPYSSHDQCHQHQLKRNGCKFNGMKYLIFKLVNFRVTTLKSEDMQNQSTLVFSVRSTLGKIKTTLQISEAL